jgi:hypothetical protein
MKPMPAAVSWRYPAPGLNTVLNRLRAKPPLPLSAHALGMDEGAVREVGRCKDHWTCGAKCSVRPHEARTHGMASRPVAERTVLACTQARDGREPLGRA